MGVVLTPCSKEDKMGYHLGDGFENHAEEKNPLLCFSGPFLELPRLALTQIPTHFRESPLEGRGANSSGLRVFSDFRGQNMRKTIAFQGIGASEQLITRRPQVRVLPPQP